MITVYGTDWCEDTRRTLRHLRRLAVRHHYLNIDEDLDALARALALNRGERRTPIVDPGAGAPLVEPDNESLTRALVERGVLTSDDAIDRITVQNVGDVERVARTAGGAALIAAASSAPRFARGPLRVLGAAVALTGVSGWCPAYYARGVTSLGGPGDRPAEAGRSAWVVRRDALTASIPAGPEEAS